MFMVDQIIDPALIGITSWGETFMHVISMKCSFIQKFDIIHIADDHLNLVSVLSAPMQLS